MNTNKDPYYNEETYRFIDAFLFNKMDASERETFLLKRKNNPDFDKMVTEYSLMVQGIEENNLRESLNDFHTEIADKPIVKSTNYYRYAIAAAFLVLIGVSSWVLFIKENHSQQIFATTFKPDPGLPTTMGTTDNYDFYEGMVSYKRKNYAEAIKKWEPMYASTPTNDTIIYFLGMAHLANNAAKQSEKYLKESQQQPASVFYEESQYYLALIFLKEDKIVEAKALLTKSTLPQSVALLKEVEKLKE